MVSKSILITNFGSIISGDMNGLRTSEVRNPFHCVHALDLCKTPHQTTSLPDQLPHGMSRPQRERYLQLVLHLIA
ncbi:MAG: hypothetical protein E5299_00807 [Burkholderia gladioli]|nr:MAG: hypothetical protein E5299_00807 [Burkholderia gladioli]